MYRISKRNPLINRMLVGMGLLLFVNTEQVFSMKVPLQEQLGNLKSSLSELKTKLETLKNKLTTLREKLVKENLETFELNDDTKFVSNKDNLDNPSILITPPEGLGDGIHVIFTEKNNKGPLYKYNRLVVNIKNRALKCDYGYTTLDKPDWQTLSYRLEKN